MKKPVKLLSSMILLSTMVMPLALHANAYEYNEHQASHWRPHGKDRVQHLVRKLNLTDEQQEKIQAIFEQQKANREANREQMKAFKTEMNHLMSAAIFDDSAFSNLQNQYQPQFAEAALQRAKSHHAILQLLDDSQREKFSKMNKRGKRLFH